MSTTIQRRKLLPIQQVPAHVSVSEAFNELTLVEFAVWMRLMDCEPDELEHRGRLAQLLKRSQRQSNAILLSLHHKGYVDFNAQLGKPTRLVLKRRAVVNPRVSSYIRLS